MALPAPEWPRAARQRLLVAFVDLRDWVRWKADAPLLLDPLESGRAQRRRIAGDRDALAMAYALHRLLLATVLDCQPMAVPLVRDRLGCPRIDLPPGERPLFTSLSHAGPFVALAVGASGSVGVDVEPEARAASLPEIAARVCSIECSVEESELLGSRAGPARNADLLALWVRKEALLKMAGVGLAQEMTGFAAPPGRALPLPAGEGMAEITMIDTGHGCVAAVAGTPGLVVDVAWIRPQAH